MIGTSVGIKLDRSKMSKLGLPTPLNGGNSNGRGIGADQSV